MTESSRISVVGKGMSDDLPTVRTTEPGTERMATTDSDRTAKRRQADARLDKIYQRLIEIHYPLAEAQRVDQELHRRTLQRLDALLEYLDDAVNACEEAAR